MAIRSSVTDRMEMLRAVAVVSSSQSTAKDAVPRALVVSVAALHAMHNITTSPPVCTSPRPMEYPKYKSQGPESSRRPANRPSVNPGKRGRLQNAPDRLALGSSGTASPRTEGRVGLAADVMGTYESSLPLATEELLINHEGPLVTTAVTVK